MTPHRVFWGIVKARADASSLGAPPFNAAADWTAGHSAVPFIHFQQGLGGFNYEASLVLYRGRREDGWQALPGADYWMKVFTWVQFLPAEYDTIPCTYYKFVCGALDDPHAAGDEPDYGYLSGRWYKPPEVEWPAFPIDYNWSYAGYTRNIPPSDLPCVERMVLPAWDNVIGDFIALPNSDEGLKNGLVIAEYAHGGMAAAGEGYTLDFNIQFVEAHYMNPTVNSLSPPKGLAAGGYPLTLTGLGLDNADDEIEEGGHARPGGWDDRVDYIYIQKPDGTAAATLQRAAGDFTVDSNTQITIPAMPALADGAYMFHLRKSEGAFEIYGYAGDWRTDASGRMRPGPRLYLTIGERAGGPVILSDWRWKKGDDYVFRHYAPVDVRAPCTFWEGMILGMSGFSRGTNDSSGLPLFPDIDVDMDNTTQEFSKLLAEYWVKNQTVEIFHAWGGEPEAVKAYVFKGIVTDYDLPHSRWKVKLGSLLQKYLDVDLPRHRATAEEYPNIHPSHVNREIPDVLGQASYTEGTTPGAVEAIYVDTAAFEYLAAFGSLHAVPEVYADGILVNPADYAVVYKDGGRTYIDFTGDKGDAKITFNAEGYSYAGWDDPSSAGGYVRNLVYVALFSLAFFVEMPESEVDVGSFDALAAEFEAAGHGQDGYLVLQDAKASASVLQELLFTCGAKLWPARDGRLTIGRKDIADIVPVTTIFDQIDVLQEPGKPTGLKAAVNSAAVSWEFYPTANLCRGAKRALRQSSIDAFEAEMTPSSPWAFPWTTSEDLVDLRVQEELLKFGFGDLRLRVTVSLEHEAELDILDTFAFQDPFALDALGGGAKAKLYSIERLTYDLLAGTIGVEAIDLQWLLRQYFIAGDFYALEALWQDASETMRMYAYACDFNTGNFADGEPGKIAGG
ncbi:MAG: hypothetical protein A2Y86_05285 [Candidatus Aminicenantes bacterium RBG_13_62_12]|nr:MAG: hypothetical protein A2Y86_05285 [Candidatus Aminicenantes bacterium RBG_13_62_12]